MGKFKELDIIFHNLGINDLDEQEKIILAILKNEDPFSLYDIEEDQDLVKLEIILEENYDQRKKRV